MKKASKGNNKFFNDYVQSVAELFINELEKNNAPWQKSWTAAELPQSAVSGQPYRGVNLLHLMAAQMSNGFSDPRWITFKQAKELGGSVKKGEHGTQCIFWKKLLVESPENSTQETSCKQSETRLIPCPFTIFNVEQCDDLKLEPLAPQNREWTPIEAAERLLKASKATILEQVQDRAFYSPTADVIVLPSRKQFKSAEGFYDTALHELGHWTGHSSRLNRDMSGGFGSQKYAREELRAEISSFMVGSAIGLAHDCSRHSGYVSSWLQVLRKDPKEIFRACADAEKIKSFIFGLDKNLNLAEETKESSKQQKTKNDLSQIAPEFLKLSEAERKGVAARIAGALNIREPVNAYRIPGKTSQRKEQER